MWVIEVIDHTMVAASLPVLAVLAWSLAAGARLRVSSVVAAAFAAGVWGVWYVVAPQMLVAFAGGLLVGWLTSGRIRRVALAVRRGLARRLLAAANRLDPDRPWPAAEGRE